MRRGQPHHPAPPTGERDQPGTTGHPGHHRHAGHDPRDVPPQVLADPGAHRAGRGDQRHGAGVVRLLARSSRGRAWVGPVLGYGDLLLRRLAVPRRRRPGDPGPGAGHDAADLDGDHGRLRRLAGHQPRLVRPGLLVGAGRAGHHHAARALAGDEGDRPGPGCARRAGRRCCPTRPSGSSATAGRAGVRGRPAGRTTWCWSGPVAGCRPTADRRRRRRARRVDDHRRVPAGAARQRATGWSPAPWPPTPRIRVRVEAVGDDTALAGIQRLVAEAQTSRGRAQALADRFAALLFYVATGAAVVTFVVWARARQPRPRRRRAPSRSWSSPARTPWAWPSRWSSRSRPRSRPGRDPRQGPAGARADAHHRRRPVRQDRHPDQGSARRHRRRPATGAATRTSCCASPPRVEADSEHPLARAIVAAAAPSAGGAATADRTSGPLTGRGVASDRRRRRVRGRRPRPAARAGCRASPDALRTTPAQWRSAGAAVLYLLRSRPATTSVRRARPGGRGPPGGPAGRRATCTASASDSRDDHRRRPPGRRGGRRRAGLPAVDEVFAEVLPEDKDQAVARAAGVAA